jgi:hypothetical protein
LEAVLVAIDLIVRGRAEEGIRDRVLRMYG